MVGGKGKDLVVVAPPVDDALGAADAVPLRLARLALEAGRLRNGHAWRAVVHAQHPLPPSTCVTTVTITGKETKINRFQFTSCAEMASRVNHYPLPPLIP